MFRMLIFIQLLVFGAFSPVLAQDRDDHRHDRDRDTIGYNDKNANRGLQRGDNEVYSWDREDFFADLSIRIELGLPDHHRRRGDREPRFSGITYINNLPLGETDFLIIASEDVTLYGAAQTAGRIYADDDIDFRGGLPSVHHGPLIAGDDITIRYRNTIAGNVRAGGRIDNRGTVQGRMRDGVRIRSLDVTALPPARSGRRHEVVRRRRHAVLAPGTYGRVTVQPGGVLELRSGIYDFERLQTDRGGEIRFDTRRGPVIVNISGELALGDYSTLTTDRGEAGSGDIYFNTRQSRTLRIGRGARVLGSILAPYADVRGEGNVRFRGSIVARDITFQSGAELASHREEAPRPRGRRR